MIKYVIKSRILVDCWTRDRKLGTVPVEIHILHTLRKLPHENLGDMCTCLLYYTRIRFFMLTFVCVPLHSGLF